MVNLFPFIYLINASKYSFKFTIFLDLNSHRIKEQSIHEYLIKADYKLGLTYLNCSVLWTLIIIYASRNRIVFEENTSLLMALHCKENTVVI